MCLVFVILSSLFLQLCGQLLGKGWPLGTLVCSLGPVVNILAIFSNANNLKNKRIKIYHIKGIGCPLLISINIVIFDQETEKYKRRRK